MKNIPVTGWDSSNWVYKKVQRSSVGHNLTPVGEVTWKHSNIVITLKWKKAIIMKQVTI